MITKQVGYNKNKVEIVVSKGATSQDIRMGIDFLTIMLRASEAQNHMERELSTAEEAGDKK